MLTMGLQNSGKSSIISLLERFYDVSQGQIRFNTMDIQGVSVKKHRKLISVVAQEPGLFQGKSRGSSLPVHTETGTKFQLAKSRLLAR